MEFNVRRQHVLRVMIIIYAVFGISLIYFLFFNTGIKLIPSSSVQDGSIITVHNESSHLIRDITLEYMKDNHHVLIAKIPSLAPQKDQSFSLTPDMASADGQIELFASAPFHLSIHNIIVIGQGDGSDSTTFQFSYPDSGYANEPVVTTVNGCNTSTQPLTLKVGLELPSDPAMNPAPIDWSIPPNDCASTSLSFVSPHVEDNLLLKIRVFTPWRTLGEGTHGVKIVPARDTNTIVSSSASTPPSTP